MKKYVSKISTFVFDGLTYEVRKVSHKNVWDILYKNMFITSSVDLESYYNRMHPNERWNISKTIDSYKKKYKLFSFTSKNIIDFCKMNYKN